jgi:hypothetical protein
MLVEGHMSVEEVKMFKCSETGKLFTTKSQAIRSANKAKAAIELAEEKAKLVLAAKEEREKLRNYIRLNLQNISNLSDMLIQKAKEFYDIDIKNLSIKLYFNKRVSNSYSCPINGVTNYCERDRNKPTGYPGWAGRMSASVKIPKSLLSNIDSFLDSANDILFNNYNSCFAGFHTGSGCPGSVNGDYDIDISFYLFLEDFPLLQEKYNKYVIEKDKIVKNKQLLNTQSNNSYNYAINSDIYKSYYAHVVEIKNKLAALQKSLQDEYIANNPVVLEEINNYKELESNFKGYS